MKPLHLMLVLSASTILLAGYSFKDYLLVTPSPPEAETPSSSARENFEAALQLAWEAAVIVQHPPHSVSTWQSAKVKWRQAIRLLQAIPKESPLAAQAKSRLTVYQANYQEISARLESEQVAVERLKKAQELAWQAAVTVQDAPNTLRVWQRADQKWQAAIALLETISPSTTVATKSQAKLATYRSNKTEIQHRIVTETQVLAALKKVSALSTRLNELPLKVLAEPESDQIGIRYQEYADLVQTLNTELDQLKAQPTAPKHPIYSNLITAIEDYKFALNLWKAYLDFEEHRFQSIYGDSLDQLVPVSSEESTLLTQKYKVKTYSNGKKVAFKFAIWEIWGHATKEIEKAQQNLLKSR